MWLILFNLKDVMGSLRIRYLFKGLFRGCYYRVLVSKWEPRLAQSRPKLYTLYIYKRVGYEDFEIEIKPGLAASCE